MTAGFARLSFSAVIDRRYSEAKRKKVDGRGGILR
jgi:hypothetical protein